MPDNPPISASPRPDHPNPPIPASPRPDHPRLRVLLADDHHLLLEGLANLLDAHGIEVVGMAHDGLEAAVLARSLKPDLILMDIRMPNCDGLKATRLIKAEMPEVKIVILTTSTEDVDLFEAVKSGACGYLLKSMDAGELVEALHQAQAGVPPFSPGLAAKLLEEFSRMAEGRRGPTGVLREDPEMVRHGDVEKELSVSPLPPISASPARLTDRQRQVLELVAEGLSYKEIGNRLSLSPRTVKYHMAEIMQRLHLDHRAQVIAYAGRHQLTD